MGRKNRRLIPPGTADEFVSFNRPSGPANQPKTTFSGRIGQSASISDEATKVDGSSLGAAGTETSSSVLILTVTTRAETAK